MAPTSPVLNDDEVFSRVEDVFDRWICGAVESLQNSLGISLAFVIISCAIEYLAGFWKGGETRKADYIKFLEKHLWFAAKYHPTDLYESLRNGLVHNFTIRDGKFALTSTEPHLHLKRTQDGQTILNLEDFFADFKRLKTEVFHTARTNATARKNFLQRHRKLGFIIYHSAIPL